MTASWNRLVSTVALPVLLLCLAMGAAAHTGLETATPADGTTVSHAPESIVLEFHGPVRLVRVTLTQDGVAVPTGFEPVAAAQATFEVPVAALRSGAVTVDWAAIGADGHTVTGSYAFTVAPASVATSTP